MKNRHWVMVVCASILLMMGTPIISAQSGTVYILIVDDFNNHMVPIVDQMVESAVYDDVLQPIISAIDARASGVEVLFQAGSIVGGSVNPALEDNAPGTDSQQDDTGGEDLPYQSYRQLLREAAPALNEVVAQSEAVYGDIEEENCAINPEGQGFFQTGGAGFFQTGGAGFFQTGGAGLNSESHGVRVRAQLEQLIASVEPAPSITLVDVDTEGFTTSIILERIQEEIGVILADDPGADIVINMSFAVVPCDQVGTLAAYDAMMRQFDPETADDLAALQAFFNTLIGSDVYDVALNPDEPLLGYLDEICPTTVQASMARLGRRAYNASTTASMEPCQAGDSGRIIMVAASGNSGEPFPYFPAAWASVVSVSASEDGEPFDSTTDVAVYSNHGRVMLPGSWTHTDGTVDVGTSFAAPRYSFLIALNLLGMDQDLCGLGTPTVITPALPNVWGINPPVAPPNVNNDIC